MAPDSSKRLKDPIEETYYLPNSFDGVTIADPFMGGGTPLLEANRIGCNVIGTVRDERATLDESGPDCSAPERNPVNWQMSRTHTVFSSPVCDPKNA